MKTNQKAQNNKIYINNIGITTSDLINVTVPYQNIKK